MADDPQLRQKDQGAYAATESGPPKLARCPYCSEEILSTARKCKHCGEWLDSTRIPAAQPGSLRIHPGASKAVAICAFGLLSAFFLPWVQLLGAGMSGYNLGQLGSYGNYAWVIPILSGATIFLSFASANNRGIGAVAGIVPLGGILYGLLRIGATGGRNAARGFLEIAGQILSIGGWLTIILSVAIIIAAAATKSPASSQSDENHGADADARRLRRDSVTKQAMWWSTAICALTGALVMTGGANPPLNVLIGLLLGAVTGTLLGFFIGENL